jgi:hypothetical protein
MIKNRPNRRHRDHHAICLQQRLDRIGHVLLGVSDCLGATQGFRDLADPCTLAITQCDELDASLGNIGWYRLIPSGTGNCDVLDPAAKPEASNKQRVWLKTYPEARVEEAGGIA